MGELITIITLAVLVIAQLVERYFYSKTMTQKLSECIKAVLSRNINEYISATQADKQDHREFVQTDNILIDELGDEAFDKFVQKQNI
jgi:hypothetical protein